MQDNFANRRKKNEMILTGDYRFNKLQRKHIKDGLHGLRLDCAEVGILALRFLKSGSTFRFRDELQPVF